MFGLFEASEVEDGKVVTNATRDNTIVGFVVVNLSIGGKYSGSDVSSDILIDVNECKLLPWTFERLHECAEGT